jgi:hypothetical protein
MSNRSEQSREGPTIVIRVNGRPLRHEVRSTARVSVWADMFPRSRTSRVLTRSKMSDDAVDRILNAQLSLDAQPSIRNLQHSPSRQFPCEHHLTEFVDVVQRAFRENRVDQVPGSKVESAQGSQYQDRSIVDPKSIGRCAYASSTSFNVPVTLPTTFNLFKASSTGGAPAMTLASPGIPTATTVPPGLSIFGAEP